ncbi:MAG: DUF2752 domain-containing protein [Oscillospiraceae bacterium]|nr:DUF2752 domain-containing protein [Oscillospiraceae bacterium]
MGREWKRAAALFLGLGVLFVLLAATGGPCLMKLTVGLPCPGCGLTRGCLSALRLDFAAAFRWHPLFWLGPPVLFFALWKQGKVLARPGANLAFWAVVGVLFFGVYLVRMFLLFPDTPPMEWNGNAPGAFLWRGLLG